MMASEIDDKESLQKAHDLGYLTYGTGGFMGDSEKAWPVTSPPQSRFSASMAVKAVRVWIEDERCKHGPIKLGDAADTVKVTGDTLLSVEDFATMVHNAVTVKEAAMLTKGGSPVAIKQQLLVMVGNQFELRDYTPPQ